MYKNGKYSDAIMLKIEKEMRQKLCETASEKKKFFFFIKNVDDDFTKLKLVTKLL